MIKTGIGVVIGWACLLATLLTSGHLLGLVLQAFGRIHGIVP
jgi:hypothetical protein